MYSQTSEGLLRQSSFLNVFTISLYLTLREILFTYMLTIGVLVAVVVVLLIVEEVVVVVVVILIMTVTINVL